MPAKPSRFSPGTWLIWSVIYGGGLLLAHRFDGTLTTQEAEADLVAGVVAGFLYVWSLPLARRIDDRLRRLVDRSRR